MQESLVSLFQMAKTAAALNDLEQAKLPFISVLTDPFMEALQRVLPCWEM